MLVADGSASSSTVTDFKWVPLSRAIESKLRHVTNLDNKHNKFQFSTFFLSHIFFFCFSNPPQKLTEKLSFLKIKIFKPMERWTEKGRS